MLVRLHRWNAALLALFIAVHLLTHYAAVAGPMAQDRVLRFVRQGYRAAPIEPLLIGLVIAQIGLGAALFLRRRREWAAGAWPRVQLASGAYLALFISIHVFAGVLRGRSLVDTNFWFAAATVTTSPAKYFFLPYYALAVTALFAHLAAVLHWRGVRNRVTFGVMGAGAVSGLLIVAAYAGALYPVELPPTYRDWAKAYLASR